MKRLVRTAALVMTAVLSLAAGKPHPNWNATVTVTPKGTHVLGNPNATVKVTEFVSYTCPHCSTFQKQSEVPMRLAYVPPGKVSIEVRHLLRDPIDLTVAMLTNCGSPEGFFKRHHVFLGGQDKWLVRMGSTSEAQRKRWTTGEMSTRLRAIASDFKFYPIMASFGYSRSAVDRCLSDKDMAEKLTAQTKAASELGVTGTPSFAIDGLLLAATHSWSDLEPQIKARL